MRAFSRLQRAGGCSLASVCNLLSVMAFLDVEHGLRACRVSTVAPPGSSSCWPNGFVALKHVGSSPTRDQTHVLCSGRQILQPLGQQGSSSFSSFLPYIPVLAKYPNQWLPEKGHTASEVFEVYVIHPYKAAVYEGNFQVMLAIKRTCLPTQEMTEVA